MHFLLRQVALPGEEEAVEVEVVEVVAGVEEEDFGGALDMAVEERGILQWRMGTITAITMSRTTLMRFAFL